MDCDTAGASVGSARSLDNSGDFRWHPGTARGIRKVSSGDTVPGVGRLNSIVRRGGRWVVTTSRGVITTD
jgi:hypothetical protein